MDLVEIRKKAKRDKQPAGKAPAAKADAVQPATQKSLPATERPAAEPTVQPQVQTPAALETTTDAGPLETTTKAPAGFDALDELFSAAADINLATEESYLQGLQDRDPSATVEKQQWLTFGLGKEHYAVNIRYVKELIKPRDITDIPRVPGFILGIISLRGIIVPIYDLRRRLKLEAAEIDLSTRIVVCEQGDRVAGLLVDSITQVVKFSEQEIEPPPAVLSGLDRELVEGVGRVQGKMIVLLDLPSVLDAELN